MVRKNKIGVLQTKKYLTFSVLFFFSFAGSFAKISTLIRQFNLHRLRIQRILKPFANEKLLIFNVFSVSRLRHRLQSCQLSPLTSLQVQAVSFAVCKEQTIVNQSIHSNLFEKPFCRMQKNAEGRVYEQTPKKK